MRCSTLLRDEEQDPVSSVPKLANTPSGHTPPCTRSKLSSTRLCTHV